MASRTLEIKADNHDAFITCSNCGIEFSGRMHGNECPICGTINK